jgi:outer membrane lipoprotein-sorting protein
VKGVALFGLVLLAAGCGGASCPANLLNDPARVLAAQGERSGRIRSLRAQARVDQRTDKGRIKGKVMMFVERPERVRFDVMTQFGPALILTSDGSALALSDFKENRYYTGASCPANIARIVGVALSGSDVVSVLFGDAPPLPGTPAGNDAMKCSGDGSYVVERKTAEGGREELEFGIHEDDFKKPAEQQRLTLIGAKLWGPSGKRQYSVRYEDYASVGGGVSLPHTVRITDDAGGADAVLRFEKMDVNVEVPAEAFSQTPRSGLTLEALSCE